MRQDFYHDFGPFGDHVWINCSHQGALPRLAAEEAYEAINWKLTPHELVTERFSSVPARVRAALASLLNARPEEIVLANSASYGLHLLANGIPWRSGDEVLLVQGDFPSDILPWLGLQKRGVRVRFLMPASHLPEPEELQAHISPSTRLFCTTWVHSFSGKAADIEALGQICREHGVRLVVNASQAVGARPLEISSFGADAVTSVGFKYLCGPYGTGFCWIRQDLLRSLEYNQVYWLSLQTADDLGREDNDPRLPEGPPTARTYDVFGTANFFNFKPWAASIEYLLGQGIRQVAEYDQGLVSSLIDGLDAKKYRLISPREGAARSNLVFISHQNAQRNHEIFQGLRDKKIYTAYRKGLIRLSPHLYNTKADIDKVLAVLDSVSP